MEKYSLAGKWKIRSTDGKFDLEASMPGSFFQALEESGYWGEHDVFYRENNRQCVELADRDFVFEREFTFEQNIAPEQRVMLEADGLDTLASLYLNDQLVARTDNMHRRYAFDVGALLKNGKNRIRIEFANTIAEITKRDDQRHLWQVGTPVRGANHLRKMYCSFGWDWGPQIPDVGIYRDLRLVTYDSGRLTDVHVVQTHRDGQVELAVEAAIENWSDQNLVAKVEVRDPVGKLVDEKDLAAGEGRLTVEQPQLWWPNGLGEQPLYTIKTSLYAGDKLVHTDDKRLGLRNLTVRREPDQWGESFEFAVNGQSFFAAGANYIPEDVYLNRVTPESRRALLTSCEESHFNCLRVWGGGVYPSDDFFDLCDELGIVVWQDLMFACAIYDVHNPDFYANIEAEVRDNLRRIRHHASLGLICGNNEMEWAFEEWGFPHTKENRAEYIKQYEVLLPQLAAEVCPEVFYWPASPSSGGCFEEPNHPDRGDVHYWDVWHGRKSYTEFRKHYFRFLSEFGFQSFPNVKTVESYTAPEDRNIFSPVMEDHQRNESENGNAKIFHFISDYYRYPKDFASLIYVSQLSQAEAVRYGVEHMRQNRGRCMGSTYWQLNDNWPTASWSSIDYFRRWKALQYAAKRVYAPTLLSIREEPPKAQIHLSHEGWETVSGKISWQLLTLRGECVDSGEQAVEVEGFSSQCIFDLDFTEKLADHADRDRYLSVRFENRKTGETLRACATFVPYKHLDLADPQLSYQVDQENDQLVVRVKAKAFAKFVGLDLKHGDAVFSDNFFDLDAGEERSVTVLSQDVSQEQLAAELVVRSVFDTFE